ncbi:hypothetical protein PV08_03641 [Exophiala spinifera]|uniref:Uncharacterized protein n=1 Tax=Exophiala spinifera TaxID=91928 RepID=A0A0D1YVN0_9EURO|nr:uncharacterized protein PV08_03641 [Exophiala spinifera]KIW19346.1 hypothetical protein PV08_03641 [Exophiala spinifera]
MVDQGSTPNIKKRRTNAAQPPLGQRQGQNPASRQRQQDGGISQQDTLGGAQAVSLPTQPRPVQHPLGGTFAGPAGRWRQYTPREVDAYHGLLALRYGPMVEFPRSENPNLTVNPSLTMSSLPGLVVGSDNTSENQPAGSKDNRTVAVANMRPPPAGAANHQPQTGSLKRTQRDSDNETQDSGNGRKRPRPPPKRYSCYLCEYTALGVTYVSRHLQNKHDVASDQIDQVRIRASEVQCLW